jgi:molecular chaperone GrpE
MKNKKTLNDQPTALQEPIVDPKVTALENDLANLKAGLARAMADYQNLEKRYERESSSVIKFANASLIERLLEIRDHLGAASAHLKDASLTMILSSLDKVLSEEGVITVDTSGVFDPSAMECQDSVPGEKDKVIAVVRPGYKLHDRLLRAARVTVGNGQRAESISNKE